PGREIRSDAITTTRGASSSLQCSGKRWRAWRAYTLQSPRWAGGRLAGGPLLDGRAARVRAAKSVRRDLPANRADTRRHLDVLRPPFWPWVAAQHPYGRESPLAGQYPPVERR